MVMTDPLESHFMCLAENTLTPSWVEALAYFVSNAFTFNFSVAKHLKSSKYLLTYLYKKLLVYLLKNGHKDIFNACYSQQVFFLIPWQVENVDGLCIPLFYVSYLGT